MAITDVQAMTAKLHGQTLNIPNLKPLFSRWSYRISPHYNDLEKTVNAKIREWITDERVLKHALDINATFFSAAWWPDATLDRLETMAWYTVWIVLWDDVVEDSIFPNSVGSSHDSRIEWLHEKGLKYVQYELGLSGETEAVPPPTQICGLFKHCADALRAECTMPERQRLYNELKYYMDCCKAEQKQIKSGALPSLDKYWDHRFGSSTVNTYSALGEYMCGRHIPQDLFDKNQMTTMWFELNRNIVALNDLLSLKKEMLKQWPGLVAIRIHDTGSDLEAAVSFAIDMVRVAGEKVEKAGDDLIAMVAHDPEAQASVTAYVELFRTNMTGNYYWSLECGRYGVKPYIQKDGSLLVPL